MKKVTCGFARHFIYGKRKDLGEGKKELVEVLCNEIAFKKLMTIGSLSRNKIFLSAQTALICNIFYRYLLISVKDISQKLEPIQQK